MAGRIDRDMIGPGLADDLEEGGLFKGVDVACIDGCGADLPEEELSVGWQDLSDGSPLLGADLLGVVDPSLAQRGLHLGLAHEAADHQGAEYTASTRLVQSEGAHYRPAPAAIPARSTVIRSEPGATLELPARAS